MIVYINGKFVDSSQALVSVWDHGFLYGDGVFEGIRAYNGNIFKLRQHTDRLYKSAKSLMIPIEMTIEEMEQNIVETCRKNELKDAYIRVIVSRGVGDLGIDPRKCCSHSTIVIIAGTISLYPQETYEKGLNVITSATHKMPVAVFSPQIKSLNYLANIKAKQEAINAGADEALMLSAQGYVTECTTENIFIVSDSVLITPPVYVGLLEGVTRNTVMEIARWNAMVVEEKVFSTHDIYTADECFVTGTAAELLPVTKLDGRIIGDGKAGPITKKLLADYRKLTSDEGTAI